ncbi:hypothetical protein P154DRAFT_624325 [Amniculicola lignicola CBS 123094]|uniref:N-acetyltransferase domain-containing protein n=1 Tax=Amniculicola lignicola CBS 123094 TaxID=1392246 RepID=A0A6A5W1X5_9PLEO|nr:hypothetical protein P154DRAFT_624325 [Amniculicola lignicola CBS 123094]
MSATTIKVEDDFIVGPAESLEQAQEIACPLMKDLGWNRNYDDAQTHFIVSRHGADWLIFKSKSTSKTEGCIIAFVFPNKTGWIGLLLLNAPLRGQGYGRKIINVVEEGYNAIGMKVIGLDGVSEQVAHYQRRGFTEVGRIHIMARPSLVDKALDGGEQVLTETNATVVDIRSVDPTLLARSDLEHTGLDRSALWTQEALFNRQDVYGYVLVSTPMPPNVLGYILVRRCDQGHRFGPLYAEDIHQAQYLLNRAMSHVEKDEGSMIAEIFGSNENGRKVFEDAGWSYTGMDYHRMWLGGRAPEEQREGGKGPRGMFAIFDAAMVGRPMFYPTNTWQEISLNPAVSGEDFYSFCSNIANISPPKSITSIDYALSKYPHVEPWTGLGDYADYIKKC